MGTLLLLLAGAIVSALAAVLLQEPVSWIFIRVFGGIWPVQGVKVRGIWSVAIEVTAAGTTRSFVTVMRVRQFGGLVSGKCEGSTEGDFCPAVSGRLSGQFITGRWYAESTLPAFHHGAFQSVLDPSGRSMAAMGVGFDRNSDIQSSLWRWTLESSETRGADTKEILERVRAQQVKGS